MLALVCGALSVVLMERQLRLRAEARLEKAVMDLSRLLVTDAKAGAVLGQRINALVDQDAGKRLENMEADVSVLGTVVRQVAEAVAELEHNNLRSADQLESTPPQAGRAALAKIPLIVEPTIALDAVKKAIDDNRLAIHLEPIVTLPQRRPFGYDVVPRLVLEDGRFADRAEFLPVRGGDTVVQIIDFAGVSEAVAVARRARSAGQSIRLFVPLHRATLADAAALDRLVSMLEPNRAVAAFLAFSISEATWSALDPAARSGLGALVKIGSAVSLSEVGSLRADFGALAEEGVRSVRVDAGRFIDVPNDFTDFHAADIPAYLTRYGIALIATGVASEQQILHLLDVEVGLVQGPHIGLPGPVRPELMVERSARETALRRMQA